MLHAGDSIFEALKAGTLLLNKYLSETDAESIPTDGYSLIEITQAGAAETRGLANGREGQLLVMVNTVYAADTVVTPSSLANGTTITFNAAYDAWVGVFVRGAWHTLLVYGTAAIA